jgi:hypothetical protein
MRRPTDIAAPPLLVCVCRSASVVPAQSVVQLHMYLMLLLHVKLLLWQSVQDLKVYISVDAAFTISITAFQNLCADMVQTRLLLSGHRKKSHA